MSSRFHNKYHRHNHHTTPISDPRYPDSSHDPIASPESPFLGPFVLTGPLSATSNDSPAGVFIGSSSSAIAVHVLGSIQTTGTLNVSGGLAANNISFTGNVLNTYSLTPLIATGEFLQITVNGLTRYVRLWNLY